MKCADDRWKTLLTVQDQNIRHDKLYDSEDWSNRYGRKWNSTRCKLIHLSINKKNACYELGALTWKQLGRKTQEYLVCHRDTIGTKAKNKANEILKSTRQGWIWGEGAERCIQPPPHLCGTLVQLLPESLLRCGSRTQRMNAAAAPFSSLSPPHDLFSAARGGQRVRDRSGSIHPMGSRTMSRQRLQQQLCCQANEPK